MTFDDISTLELESMFLHFQTRALTWPACHTMLLLVPPGLAWPGLAWPRMPLACWSLWNHEGVTEDVDVMVTRLSFGITQEGHFGRGASLNAAPACF